MFCYIFTALENIQRLELLQEQRQNLKLQFTHPHLNFVELNAPSPVTLTNQNGGYLYGNWIELQSKHGFNPNFLLGLQGKTTFH